MKYQNSSTNKTKVEIVYKLFLENPLKVFTSSSIKCLFGGCCVGGASSHNMATLLTRLWRNGKIIRTKTQLSDGYYYSLNNKEKLDELYFNYLLPYDFSNKELLGLIELDKFEALNCENFINFNDLSTQKFLMKYGKNDLIENNVDVFLAKIVAFIMGDGHIKKNRQNIYFYFKHLHDAEKFVDDFKFIFNQERMRINKTQFCYEALISSQHFGRLLEELGAPIGNKVTKSFCVPLWVYYGPERIKLAFLAVIYGNEGSKPWKNRWRIQFVISKNKENVRNLLVFLNQIRAMLNHFGISTSFIQLRKQKGRHFCGRFYIKGKENLHKFYKLLEFSYASEKQRYLESLIKTDSLKCNMQ